MPTHVITLTNDVPASEIRFFEGKGIDPVARRWRTIEREAAIEIMEKFLELEGRQWKVAVKRCATGSPNTTLTLTVELTLLED